MVRRALAVLLSLLLFATTAQAGWLYAPSSTLTELENTWSQVQHFDAGLDVRYSSVLFDRLSVNSSGNLLFAATEKAPGAATAALAGLGAGNVNTGTHSYKITFVTAGGETDAGAVSGTVTTTAGDGQVALSAIPTGSTYVTSRKVYRTAAGNAVTGPWLLLATIADNTTTTYADNIADASLTTAVPSANTAIDTRWTFKNSGVLDIANTAPSLTFTDTTASAKSLTIAVDANLAQFRESAGASGSLLTLDLTNNYVGIGTAGPNNKLEVSGGNGILITPSGGAARIEAGGIGLQMQGGSPALLYQNTSAAANNKVWTGFETNTTQLFGRVLNDALSSAQNWITVTRSGATVSSVVFENGNVGIGTTTPASLLDLRAGDLTMSGENGQKYVQGRATELITVASGVLSQASTITIPANAILKAAEMRVTVQPGGTATMVATATTSATVLQQGASMSTAAGTTDVGTRAWGTNYTGVAAQTVTFTFNGVTSDALGRIRLDLYYEVPTAATS